MADTTNAWVPLQARHDADVRIKYKALSDYVTDWLFAPMWGLMEDRLQKPHRESSGRWGKRINLDLVRDMELALRVSLVEYVKSSYAADFSMSVRLLGKIESIFEKDDLLMLSCLDYLLSRSDLSRPDGFAENVRETLQAGGSAWTVGQVPPDRLGLVKRVPDAMQEAFEAAVAERGDSANLLASAWGRAYGMNPDPGPAYHDAVRAVEAAAHPVVTPNNNTATLGTIIGEMKADLIRWEVVLDHDAKVNPPEVVVQMMDLLWTNEYERHATNKKVPLHVTPEQAEAAVVLAVTLVSWFRSGHVRRV